MAQNRHSYSKMEEQGHHGKSTMAPKQTHNNPKGRAPNLGAPLSNIWGSDSNLVDPKGLGWPHPFISAICSMHSSFPVLRPALLHTCSSPWWASHNPGVSTATEASPSQLHSVASQGISGTLTLPHRAWPQMLFRTPSILLFLSSEQVWCGWCLQCCHILLQAWDATLTPWIKAVLSCACWPWGSTFPSSCFYEAGNPFNLSFFFLIGFESSQDGSSNGWGSMT